MNFDKPMPHFVPHPPSPLQLMDAAEALRAGKLVVVATETVFGVVADASNEAAVDALYAAKGRASGVPLQLLISGAEMAESIAVWSDAAERIAATFWPGPLTLVLPLHAHPEYEIADNVLAGGRTIGLRVPNHGVVQALLAVFGAPLAASSANVSGQPPAHTAAEAMAALGHAVAMVLDGPCDVDAQASTVVALSNGQLTELRAGAISLPALQNCL